MCGPGFEHFSQALRHYAAPPFIPQNLLVAGRAYSEKLQNGGQLGA